MEELLRQFGEDPTVRITAALVVLDFVLGVAASIKLGAFRLSYIADFMRNDVVGKLLPLYAVWAVTHLVGDFQVGGLELIEESTAAVAIGALSGSVLNSLRDLGLLGNLRDEVAGPDPSAPDPPATTPG